MTDMSEHAEHAQRRAERAREDLGETIDALKQKMSVNELVDELKNQFMSSGGVDAATRTMSTLSRQVQDNPLALAMIAAGFGWLMMGGRSTGDRSQASWNGGASVRSPSTAYGGAMPTDVLNTDAYSEGFSEGGSSEGSLSSAMSSAQDTLDSAAQSARAAARSAMDAGRSAINNMSDLQYSLQRSSSESYERYPIVFGAAALALGAIVGAALPSTEFENEKLGETSDRLKDQMMEQGAELAEQARSVVGEGANEVRGDRGFVSPTPT